MSYVDFRYNYVALPIKVGYTVGRKGFAFGKLGIVPAVLLKAAFVTPDNFFTGPETAYDITGSCNSLDLGGIAEAGGGFHFSQHFQLFGSLAYQRSLTRIAPRGTPMIPARHHGWNLHIGLRYELPARTAAAAAPASS